MYTAALRYKAIDYYLDNKGLCENSLKKKMHVMQKLLIQRSFNLQSVLGFWFIKCLMFRFLIQLRRIF